MTGSPVTVRRPWFHPLNLLRKLMLYVVIGYVLVCAFLYVMQQQLIYVGAHNNVSQAMAKMAAENHGLMLWDADAPGGYRGCVRKDFKDPAPRGTILFLHGNGEVAWSNWDVAEMLRTLGFRTLLYEYPGYGGRPGAPSERIIVPDVQAVARELDHAGLGPVYLCGFSLGAGVASAVCADETLPVHGLMLGWPWDTLPNVAQAHYPFIPVHLLMKDNYDSVANLAHFAHPICVLRSDEDEVIPPRCTLRLFAALPEPKKMILFSGCRHYQWPRGDDAWWGEALDFIAPK